MFDVIFDRDGVLNVDTGYTYRLEDCTVPDGVLEALAMLRDAGARFSIATGQSGIALGKYTETEMRSFNNRLAEQFAANGLKFATIAFCPHHPTLDDCECRKPKQGLLREIEAKLGPIEWMRAWGIGDKPADSEMILSAGGHAILMRNNDKNNRTGVPYWNEQDPALAALLANPRHHVADTVLGAAEIILGAVTR